MKYYSNNKIGTLIVLVLILICSNSFAQKNSYSPYSRFGLGDIHNQSSAHSIGMGSASVGVIDPFNINLQNPASYSFLYRPILNVGLQTSVLNLDNGRQQERLVFSNPYYINIALKREGGNYGWLLGIRPYSSIGYDIDQRGYSDETGEIDYQHSGEGGILRGYFGGARKFDIFERKLLKDSTGVVTDTIKVKNNFSVGANLNYYFGTLTRTERVDFESEDFLGSRRQFYTSVSGLSGDFGILYRHHLKVKKIAGKVVHKNDITFGFNYELGNNVNTKVERIYESLNYSATILGQRIAYPLDTALNITEGQNEFYIPQRYRVGFSWIVRGDNGSTTSLAFDFAQRDWTNLTVGSGGVDFGDIFKGETELSAGLSFTPADILQEYDASLLRLITYRVGFRMNDGYISLSGEDLSTRVITGGLTLPLRASSSMSKFNLGIELGNRGTTDQGLIRESFTNFYFGFSFSPSYYDQWFKRKKYD